MPLIHHTVVATVDITYERDDGSLRSWIDHILCSKEFSSQITTTVEPLNKGQVGTSTDVHYSGVVLYWAIFAKNPSFYLL